MRGIAIAIAVASGIGSWESDVAGRRDGSVMASASTTSEEHVTTEPPASADTILDTPVLPIFTGLPLPRLSPSDREAFIAEFRRGLDSWLGLSGLDKVEAPSPLSDEIRQYRQAWAQEEAAIAPFLGHWQEGADFPYAVSIFPSTVAGQVCVLEFKPEWSLMLWNEAEGDYSIKDVITEQILSFSVATVAAGELRSSQVRTTTAAIAEQIAPLQTTPSEFMGIMDEVGTMRVVAVAGPPTLPPELPTELIPQVWQALSDHSCMVSLSEDSAE